MSQWLVAPVCMAPAGGPTAVDADLIGTWKLAGGEIEFQDTGERRPLYGADRLGYIIFTPEGRMMGMIEGDGRRAPRPMRIASVFSGQCSPTVASIGLRATSGSRRLILRGTPHGSGPTRCFSTKSKAIL